MTAHISTRLRLLLLGCAIAALSACGSATSIVPTPTLTATVTRPTVGGTATAPTSPTTATSTRAPSASGSTAVTPRASGSVAGAGVTAPAPAGTPIAFQTPAVGVSASGVGRLEVQFGGTFEAVCIYRIAGTGLMPRTQIVEVGASGGKVEFGPVAADGTYRSSDVYQAPLHSGTLTATARDGSAVTTQYLVPCSPPGAGHA